MVEFLHLLTRAQCELLISRRSTQYPRMGLPLSFGSFQITSMLLAVMSSISGFSGASGGSEERQIKSESHLIYAAVFKFKFGSNLKCIHQRKSVKEEERAVYEIS